MGMDGAITGSGFGEICCDQLIRSDSIIRTEDVLDNRLSEP